MNERSEYLSKALVMLMTAGNFLDCAVQLSGDDLGREIDSLETATDELAARAVSLLAELEYEARETA